MRVGGVLVWAATGLMAASAEMDTILMYETPGWSVALHHQVDTGTLFCAAETAGEEALFMVTAHDSGAVIAVVQAPASGGAVAVAIDGSSWPAQRMDDAAVVMLDPNAAGPFLAEIAAGKRVAVTVGQTEIAALPLAGAAGALTAMLACWDSLAMPQTATF